MINLVLSVAATIIFIIGYGLLQFCGVDKPIFCSIIPSGPKNNTVLLCKVLKYLFDFWFYWYISARGRCIKS